MKSKIFLQLIIFCFACFVGVASAAEKISPKEAEVWVNQKGKELLETFSLKDIRTKYAKLDDMFLNDVDLDYIGKFVVGKYWRQMSKEQQERYIPLFKRYSLSLYKGFPLNFNFDINFKVTKLSNKSSAYICNRKYKCCCKVLVIGFRSRSSSQMLNQNAVHIKFCCLLCTDNCYIMFFVKIKFVISKCLFKIASVYSESTVFFY